MKNKSTKAVLVAVLLSRFLESRSSIRAHSCQQIIQEFGGPVDVPYPCTCCVVPIVSAHFDGLYEQEVATILCRPPHVICTFSDDSIYNPRIKWFGLPLDVLVSRLHRLTMDVLITSIQCILSKDRPTINSCSRCKTCIGLIQHILTRAHYLECAGTIAVCNIYISYYPFEAATDKKDNFYIARILRHEYSQIIIDTLVTSPEACMADAQARVAEGQKIAWRERRAEDVSAARQTSVAWPSVVPQKVILSCLNRYYEGSKWTEPPVCVVCGQYQ